MIVAWSAGGVLGPFLAAFLYERGDGYALPFTVIGVVALVAAALPALTRPPGARATSIVDLRERKDAGTPSR